MIQAERFRETTELPRGMFINNPVGETQYHDTQLQGGLRNLTSRHMPIHGNTQMQTLPVNNFNTTDSGMPQGLANVENVQNQGITDDEFFHLTCHVDPNMKEKIEWGEFIDLEKLLVKDRFRGHSSGAQRMGLVNKGGETYFLPIDKEYRISNVWRWEQAFRIYVAIYSHANPHRSAEIWQYVFVINSAASTYTWENMANYDYTFRQLMACNPNRSWANIYFQMWNLMMRDVLTKQNYSSEHQSKGGTKQNKRSTYCWAFNRGEKCKFDPNCKFIEKCSYCDSTNHGRFECPKIKDKKGRRQSQS